MKQFSRKKIALMVSLFILTFSFALPGVFAQSEVFQDPDWVLTLALDAQTGTTKIIATVEAANDWEWKASFRFYGPMSETAANTENDTVGWTLLTPDFTIEDDTPTGTGPWYFEVEMPVGEGDLGWWYVEVDCNGIQGGEVWPHVAYGIINLANPVPWFTDLPVAMLVTVGAVVLLKRRGKLNLPV
jgi:hypothetical protein